MCNKVLKYDEGKYIHLSGVWTSTYNVGECIDEESDQKDSVI